MQRRYALADRSVIQRNHPVHVVETQNRERFAYLEKVFFSLEDTVFSIPSNLGQQILRAFPDRSFIGWMEHERDGSPKQLVRMGGKFVVSIEEFARQEVVTGEYGGQFASFEWVWSPRGQDGRPMKM